jgi:nucleoid-associated protein YejK
MTRSIEYEDFIYDVCKALGEEDRATLYRNKAYTGRISGRDINVDVSFETQLLGVRTSWDSSNASATKVALK